MPIIEFLAAYARLFLDRCAREYPALANEVVVRYYEDTDTGEATVALSARGVVGVEISVPHRLTDYLEERWHPVLEQDQWDLFIKNVTAPQPDPEDELPYTACSCGAYGEVNYDVGGPDERYYCGGPHAGCWP